MPKFDVDLFVIGAGSGGVRASRIAANHGAKVAIAEERFYGGTCVNVGCVPKKLMTYAAKYASHLKDAAGYGWNIEAGAHDWSIFIQNKNQEIQRLNTIYQSMLEKEGVQIHWGRAQITGPHAVRINDQDISARHIVIATGGKITVPDIPGAREYGITSDDVFYLSQRPENIAIVGAGFIALEFAGIFNQLGSNVKVLLRRNEILNEGFDQDVRTFLHAEMQKKGIEFLTQTNVESVEKQESHLKITLTDGQTLEVDQILFATGRAPNSKGLGLEELGVRMDKNGAIHVDKNEQTNIPSIYAVGDVTDRIALTPVALAEGHALADRLFGNKNRYISYENVPSAVFSDPNVAQVGLTESQAHEKYGEKIDTYKSDFRAMQMTLAGRDERTFMKLIVHGETDKVLGLHMVGAEAGEIVQGFATALIAGATKADFDNTIGIHPTSAEEFVTMRTKSH